MFICKMWIQRSESGHRNVLGNDCDDSRGAWFIINKHRQRTVVSWRVNRGITEAQGPGVNNPNFAPATPRVRIPRVGTTTNANLPSESAW